MEKRYKSINFSSIFPGILVFILIIFIFFLLFLPFFIQISKINQESIHFDSKLFSLFKFSFQQAFFSTILSTILAIPTAKAIYRRNFFCKEFFLKLCLLTSILPSLIAILAILNIYGKNGWISYFLKFLKIDYHFSIYGIKGILITHIFYNMPLAIYLFFNTLKNVPNEHQYLAMQLNLNGWNYFQIIEWPFLKKQIISVFVLVFVLCFNNLSTILTFGGGKNTTTIILEIYEALNYEFNLPYASFLSILQTFFCFSILIISQICYRNFHMNFSVKKKKYTYIIKDHLKSKIIDSIIISIMIFFLFLPIFSLIFDGLNYQFKKTILNIALWEATMTSLRIAILSGILCIFLTIIILWTIREIENYSKSWSYVIEYSSIILFSVPNIVLATSFFLTFYYLENTFWFSHILIIIINALMTLPYSIKILKNTFDNLHKKYNILCISLNIKGWNRFKFIEFKCLKNSILKTLAFCCILSIGDFDIMALFGNQNFCTLSCYLYQSFSSYNYQESTVIALFLLFFCFILFLFIENFFKNHVDIK